jgi:tetratricopeptide (TPR) repeat protein
MSARLPPKQPTVFTEIRSLALTNRVRHSEASKNTPILVLSGYLNRADFRLMAEFPMIATLEKPYAMEEFGDIIKDLQAEAEFYTKEDSLVEATFAKFTDDPENFIKMLIPWLSITRRPIPLAVKGSRILQEHGFLEAAETILKIILTADPDCLLGLHELGKCYLRQRRFDEAKKVLIRANASCPNNIERLCLLGRANLHTNSFVAAKEHFQEALTIDGESKPARQGLNAAKIAIMSSSEINEKAISRSFVSALNALGIVNVHSQKYSEAVELYDSALQYSTESETKIKLTYNKGLAFLRWNKPETALQFFQESADLSQQQFGKAMQKISLLSKKYGMSEEWASQEIVIADESIGGGNNTALSSMHLSDDLNDSPEFQEEIAYDEEDQALI